VRDPLEQGAVDPEPGTALPSRMSLLLRELARLPTGDRDPWERALRPGALLHRFELVRELGRGGFGVVWEARDTALGRSVAFKAVCVGARPDAGEGDLLREAEAAARLSHPNIVTLHDVGRTEHGPYLVFELLRGETLAARLDHGPMPVPEAVRVGAEVAKGLAHAHANGVVHRDLTPGNVFLCDDGQVKVLDLGMARAFGRRALAGGTPGYMAPEQKRGAPEDERTDVFALGVILHRMLAGDLPFPPGASIGRPREVLDVAGAPALGTLVARMLATDPVERPRDAGEVAPALAAFGRELEAAPGSGDGLRVRRRRRGWLRLALAAGAALVVAVALAVAVTRSMGWRVVLAPASAPSIAVLPFDDLSPKRDQEYFSDGLADEILNALARIEGVRVPSRTSSFAYKGRSASVGEIGRELNVATVLEGSVRTSGDRVRVTAQLVNVADGYRIWSRTYDRERTDVFAVQDDIASGVVEALHGKLVSGAPRPSVKPVATENPDVYDQYLLGRHHYHRLTPQGFRLAVAAFENAIRMDPRYAPAWAGLAIPLLYLAEEAETPEDVAAQRRRALAAAEKAVELDPDLPDALSSRGVARELVRRDFAGAEADFERALAVNPNDASTRRRYAALLSDTGRLAEGIEEARRSVDLDPLGQAWGTLGTLYQSAGRLDEAEHAIRRHLELSPESLPGLVALGRNQLLQGRPAAALASFEACKAESFKLWGRAMARHDLGETAAARRALDELVAKHAHASALSVAEVYAWRGEADAAIAWLERAVVDGTALALDVNPFLRRIRDDPRFAAVVAKTRPPAD
jgi:serine/threonine-protein kinase